MRTNNQRLMVFSENIDRTEAKGEHKFYFFFSKDYIKNKKVLDLGSWTGPFDILIYNLASEITAVDIEEKALKVLKKNLPKVKCVRAKSHKLPFKENSFDVVTFWDVIEHIPVGYELSTLKEINRVLRENGYLFLGTVDRNFWSNLLDPAYWLVGHRHYTRSQLESLLVDAGFKVEKAVRVGSFFTSFYSLSFYFFKYIFRTRMPKISLVENKFEKDISSPGFVQNVIRAKKVRV